VTHDTQGDIPRLVCPLKAGLTVRPFRTPDIGVSDAGHERHGTDKDTGEKAVRFAHVIAQSDQKLVQAIEVGREVEHRGADSF
jgi:hypothetical protein